MRPLCLVLAQLTSLLHQFFHCSSHELFSMGAAYVGIWTRVSNRWQQWHAAWWSSREWMSANGLWTESCGLGQRPDRRSHRHSVIRDKSPNQRTFAGTQHSYCTWMYKECMISRTVQWASGRRLSVYPKMFSSVCDISKHLISKKKPYLKRMFNYSYSASNSLLAVLMSTGVQMFALFLPVLFDHSVLCLLHLSPFSLSERLGEVHAFFN